MANVCPHAFALVSPCVCRSSFQIAEKALELFVGIENTGTQGSLGDVEKLGDLLVREPHNVTKGHDFSVSRGELVESLTEAFLDVRDIDAEGIFSFAFAQKVASLVGGNCVEPGVKGAFFVEIAQ